MTRIADRNSRVPQLVERFSHYVEVFERAPAFTRAGQMEFHVETIRQRRQLGSARAAIENDAFLLSLYETLRLWGIGVRASVLVGPPHFMDAIRSHADLIASFDNMHLDDERLHVGDAAKTLWI